jgi:hypothetical protein
MFASSAAAAGLDPEAIVAGHELSADLAPRTLDAVLAAHAGFCLAGSLERVPPTLAPIVAAKAELGLGAITWLERRVESRPRA